MELPVHPSKTLFNCSFRFKQNNNKAAPLLYWNSTVCYVLLLKKHKRWSINKSQDSLSGIWKATALWGVVSSTLPSTILRLKSPLKEVICYWFAIFHPRPQSLPMCIFQKHKLNQSGEACFFVIFFSSHENILSPAANFSLLARGPVPPSSLTWVLLFGRLFQAHVFKH